MTKRPIIDGATRVLGIVGDPIAQVRAPEVWTGLFQAHGLNTVCIPFHVRPEQQPIAQFERSLFRLSEVSFGLIVNEFVLTERISHIMRILVIFINWEILKFAHCGKLLLSVSGSRF